MSGEFCWTEKYVKIEEYVNIYNKLFIRNYFSKYSEVQLEINFVISKMKVYLEKFFLLNIHEATSLLDQDKPQITNSLQIFNFFSTKTAGLT